jgi:hypothetical protein
MKALFLSTRVCRSSQANSTRSADRVSVIKKALSEEVKGRFVKSLGGGGGGGACVRACVRACSRRLTRPLLSNANFMELLASGRGHRIKCSAKESKRRKALQLQLQPRAQTCSSATGTAGHYWQLAVTGPKRMHSWAKSQPDSHSPNRHHSAQQARALGLGPQTVRCL